MTSLVSFIAGATITAALYEAHIRRFCQHPGFHIASAPLLRRTMWHLRWFSRATFDVVCGDIDNMKTFNSGSGDYAFTNGLIGGAFMDLRIRGTDALAWGQYLEGDEFVGLIPQGGPGAGRAVAQRLQACLNAQPIPDAERARLEAAGVLCLAATMTVITDVPARHLAAAAARGMSATLARKRAGERGTIRAVPWAEAGSTHVVAGRYADGKKK